MGATFIALSADHVVSKHIIKSKEKLGALLINIGVSQPVQKLSSPDKKKLESILANLQFTQFQENTFRYGLLIMFCQDTEMVLLWEFLRMMKEIFCLRQNMT